MTNSTHTNGPWHICDVTGGKIDPLIRDENGFCVAQAVKPSNSRAAYIDEQANARLIAAAPELLTALSEMLEMATHWAMPDDEKRKIVKRARLTIAKVGGLA